MKFLLLAALLAISACTTTGVGGEPLRVQQRY
jgi:hypothetical protein